MAGQALFIMPPLHPLFALKRGKGLYLLGGTKRCKLRTESGGVCCRDGLAGINSFDYRCPDGVRFCMEPFEETEVGLRKAWSVWMRIPNKYSPTLDYLYLTQRRAC